MTWAITPRGAGKAPGFRAIRDNWPLAAGETFAVTEDPSGKVLGEDGQSLRNQTTAEALEQKTKEAQRQIGPILRYKAIDALLTERGRQPDAPQAIKDYLAGMPLVGR